AMGLGTPAHSCWSVPDETRLGDPLEDSLHETHLPEPLAVSPRRSRGVARRTHYDLWCGELRGVCQRPPVPRSWHGPAGPAVPVRGGSADVGDAYGWGPRWRGGRGRRPAGAG